MSEQFGKQALSDNSTAHDPRASRFLNNPAVPNQDGQRTTAATPNGPLPTSQLLSAGVNRTMELPPLPQAPTHGSGRFSPASASRSAGVSLMLNPTEPEDLFHDRPRKIARTEPARSVPALPPLTASNRPYDPLKDASTPMASLETKPPHRMLTPRLSARSPASLHRAVSLNQLPLSARQPPRTSFPTSPRTGSYARDSGAGVSGSALPTPPVAARESYGFPAPAPSNHSTSRRASPGAIRVARLQSESTSPKSSYSGYSQAEQTSPLQYGSSLLSTLSAPYTATSSTSGQYADDGPPMKSERQSHMGIPMTSASGQNVYQMMTLETSSGTVQLPVDVQAASRVADEKRRRNAGASARFRQRRKEKEKEASTAISRLEQKLKDLSEDAEFYKRERDYFLGVVLQVPGGDRHFPRPRSPRHRRTSSRGGSGRASYGAVHEQGCRSPGEGCRNVRRRTSTASTNLPPHAQSAVNAPAPRSSYVPPPTYGQHPPQHAPGPLPSPGAGGVPVSSLMHAAPQTGVWNPYSNQRHTSGDHGYSTH